MPPFFPVLLRNCNPLLEIPLIPSPHLYVSRSLRLVTSLVQSRSLSSCVPVLMNMAGVKLMTVLLGLSLNKNPGNSNGPIMHVEDRGQPWVQYQISCVPLSRVSSSELLLCLSESWQVRADT